MSFSPAKSLQSCLTLWDTIDGSPPGSPVPGILQARTLEWGAISFSNAWKWKGKGKSLSHVRLFTTPWTAAYQALLSMGFSRREYWSGVPLPSPKRDSYWNAKEGRQEIPGVIGKLGLGVQNEAGQRLTVLPRKRTGHSGHPLPTTQDKTLHMDITRWSILRSDWLYSLQPKVEKLYTVSKNKTGSWLSLRSWTPYCQIQTEIEESSENHQTILVWPKSNPIWLHSGSDK